MSPLSKILRAEIARDGPVSFHRFMEAALYHPEHGYYRRACDPFGRAGDFYTAEQIQPVFGRLMALLIDSLGNEMGRPEDFTVVELGAGRGEMAEAFTRFRYIPIEQGRGDMPERFTGVVFANEFFDALPVHVVRWSRGRFHQMLVGFDGQRFVWIDGSGVPDVVAAYLEGYDGPREEGMTLEVNLDALAWIDTIAERLERGYLVAIDYGYTRAELARFPQGTLMTYRSPVRVSATSRRTWTLTPWGTMRAGAASLRFVLSGWRRRSWASGNPMGSHRSSRPPVRSRPSRCACS